MSADPVEAFVAFTRAELARAGLERVEFEGSVYWRSLECGGHAAAIGASESGGMAAALHTLVLLHGVNDQAGTWSTVVPQLIGNFRLIVPDLAGHGESAPAEGPIAMPAIVDQLHAILQRETEGAVTLAGNSMGGWIAILYAAAHPERVERLVLEDASGMMWPLSVPLFAQTRDDAVRILHAVHGPSAPIPEWMIDAMLLRATSSPMTRVAQAGVLQHLVDAKLPSLKMPATLIWGADDGLLPIAYAEALRQRIAGATLHVIDNAAHIPHRQQPERFVECLSKSFSPSERA